MLFQQLTNSFAWFHNERLTVRETSPVNFFMRPSTIFSAILSAYQTASRYPAVPGILFLHFSGYVFWFDEFWLACSNVQAMCLTSSSSAPLAATRTPIPHRADKNPERRLPAQQRGECDVFTNFRYQRNTFFFELCFQTSTSVILPATAASRTLSANAGNQRLLQRSQSGS